MRTTVILIWATLLVVACLIAPTLGWRAKVSVAPGQGDSKAQKQYDVKSKVGEPTRPEGALASVALTSASVVSIALETAKEMQYRRVVANPIKGTAWHATAIPHAGSRGALTLKLKEFDAPSGEYELGIAVSNSVSDTAFIHLGAIQWTNSGAAQQAVFGPEKEIRHIFRPSEKQPAMYLPVLFTGLLMLPIVILFPLWFVVAAKMPSRVTVRSVAFLGCIGLFLMLAFLYWTQLNLLQTLPLFGGLGAITVIIGVSALREHVEWTENK